MALAQKYKCIWQIKFPSGEMYFDMTERSEYAYEQSIRNILANSSHPCLRLNELAICSPWYDVNFIAKVEYESADEVLTAILANRVGTPYLINNVDNIMHCSRRSSTPSADEFRRLRQETTNMRFRLKQARQDYDCLLAQYKQLEKVAYGGKHQAKLSKISNII